ncbi:MAG: carboxymuconolactone decarboxylase family protein [Bryobacterales bacterium]|nr:carboxymuconolactone decarboxylase family protein [Bryobacterales bacterium]
MTLEELRESLPAYAKDLKLNLSTVLQQADLTPRQTWGTAVACAIACRNRTLLDTMESEAKAHLTEIELEAARVAAAIMGMNNVYYRFQHIVTHDAYRSMPARLRMNSLRTHGADPVDFELWCGAVSAVNACAACVDSHDRVVREKGLTEQHVLAAVRIAATLHAVACVLDVQ